LLPARAKAQALLAVIMVLPTPPFGEQTQINGMWQPAKAF
jgi:hypothetical protein